MKTNNYLVEYKVKRALKSHGEFSPEQITESFSMVSVTNDLNEIFTDLFDEHRLNSITGIEITGVSNLSENPRIDDL